MAFRGRGRGRGGFGGGFRPAKQLPFEPFPEIESLGTASGIKENISLAIWYSKFEKYCNSSPYYIEDANEGLKKIQKTEIERFSDRNSERTRPRPPLSHFIRMDPDYVPAELVKGSQKEKRGPKRVRWNPESVQVDDYIAKKLQERQSEETTEKKEEEEEEDDDRNEEDEEEYSDDGDYNQNKDFDDDEDDFNMVDDNDDEPIF